MNIEYWDGKSLEEWREIWRLELLREDEMLAFYDEVGGQITRKALAEKFNLRPARVGLLIRRRVDDRERMRIHAEIERFREAADFTGLAEKLWMTLGWLATALEERPR
jgi:hypothetical protein